MWRKLEKKYFDRPLSHGFVSLYTGKAVVMFTSALLGIFLPIFLYELFNQNFQAVVIYYGVGYFLYAITLTIGARFLNRFGFRRALRTSVILGVLFYSVFYFIDQGNLKYLIPFSLLTLVFYRLFYWLPYHVDFAKFTTKKDRGRQVSFVEATRLVMQIFAPLIAGFIISRFNFDALFVVAMILFAVSGISYLTIPRTREKFSWSWQETWRQFFSKKRKKMIIAYMAYGAENSVSMVVWPIFIYQLLKGDYLQVGIISSLIVGVTIILQLALGKYIDSKISKEKILGWGSVFYSFGWVIKIFIVTAFQIFVVGAYHSLARIFMQTSVDTLTYEVAADQGHYVDEFTVLKEMAMNIGKTLMVVLVIFVSLYFSIQWVFILAALASMVVNLLKGIRQERVSY